MKKVKGLDELKAYSASLKTLVNLEVIVGLPKGEKATSKIYDETGETVLEVGTKHEYGYENIPERSFLRVPWMVKRKVIEKALERALKQIEDGKEPTAALEMVALYGENVVKEAFVTRGYGNWSDISEYTKKKKGSSQVLIDTGTLRNSITSAVRKKA